MRRVLVVLAATLLVCVLAACGAHHRVAQSATGSVHPRGWGQTPPGLTLPAPALGVRTVEMFDSTTLATIPAGPFALAGYTAGFWRTYLPMRQRWPLAHTISIAISSAFHADCLDIEPGDAVPAQAGAWVLADLAAGFPRPCLYSDLAEMPAVQASLAGSLGPGWRSRVFLWLAWYRFIPGLVAGYSAVQWTDVARGLNLDESTVTLPFLSIAQPPYKPAPRPPPVCFHRRMSASQCSAVRAHVASLNGASAASWRAWHRAGCVRLLHRPGYRGACSALAQRGHYFTGRARALEAAS